MSGILKKIKKHASVVVDIMFLLICAALILFRLYILAAVIFVIAVVNRMTVIKMNKQKEPFGPRSIIRNLDYIIIGDVSESIGKDISVSGTGICIRSPGCSFAAAYEILKHTFSILREQGGKAVIVVSECKEEERNRYSLFDSRLFHRVTINRLKLQKHGVMACLPIIFAPLRSFKFLFGIGCGKVCLSEDVPKNAELFCLERNIDLSLYTKERK